LSGAIDVAWRQGSEAGLQNMIAGAIPDVSGFEGLTSAKLLARWHNGRGGFVFSVNVSGTIDSVLTVNGHAASMDNAKRQAEGILNTFLQNQPTKEATIE